MFHLNMHHSLEIVKYLITLQLAINFFSLGVTLFLYYSKDKAEILKDLAYVWFFSTLSFILIGLFTSSLDLFFVAIAIGSTRFIATSHTYFLSKSFNIPMPKSWHVLETVIALGCAVLSFYVLNLGKVFTSFVMVIYGCRLAIVLAIKALNQPNKSVANKILLTLFILNIIHFLDYPLALIAPDRFMLLGYFVALLLTTSMAIALQYRALDMVKSQYSQQFQQLMEQKSAEISDLYVNIAHKSNLESVGRMASGIAHEINNPLSVIYNHTLIIERKLKDSSSMSKVDMINSINTIIQTVQKVANITTSLQKISRIPDGGGDKYLSNVKVDEVVRDILSVSEFELKNHGIELTAMTLPNITVKANYTHLVQILINLISNAKDAVLGCRSPSIQLSMYAFDGRAYFEVSDNGSGVDPRILPLLFQPFCSTKQPGNGLGLGLCISKSLAEQMFGNLQLIPRTQTTFQLELLLA